MADPTKRSKKRKRRSRTSHPGVKLRRRTWASGRTTWFARWTDPDTGREVDTNLTALDLTTEEARRDWAIRRSKKLAKRRVAREEGGEEPTSTPVRKAVERFYANARLRPSTVSAYQAGTDRFVAWAEAEGIRKVEDLRPRNLAAFRDHLANMPRKKPAAGGRKGERHEAEEPCSPVSVNTRLRPVKTVLRHLLRLGLLPNLTRDDITDSLQPLREPKPLPVCFKPHQLAKLLKAAFRHDAATFEETRDEHAGHGERGTTPRHDPIAPFLAVVLLSGMRVSEALGLRTAAVDLQAPPAGEVVLQAGEVKTGHARSVDLSVSPALRRILAALVLKAGGAPFLFGGEKPWPRSRVEAVRKRLLREPPTTPRRGRARPAAGYGAPAFDWQALRSTCGSYLTNAPGIFGAASAYRSAKQLGHSVQVAERHYLGLVRGIPHEATDLESAMKIGKLLEDLIGQLTEGRGLERAATSVG